MRKIYFPDPAGVGVLRVEMTYEEALLMNNAVVLSNSSLESLLAPAFAAFEQVVRHAVQVAVSAELEREGEVAGDSLEVPWRSFTELLLTVEEQAVVGSGPQFSVCLSANIDEDFSVSLSPAPLSPDAALPDRVAPVVSGTLACNFQVDNYGARYDAAELV